MRGNGEGVTSRVVPGGKVAKVDVLVSIRVLYLFAFISSILLSLVSRVK